jgi:anaerobic selenocysteine-containing dehydrogenase
MEESAWYADLILPVCSGLEFEGVYMRRDDRAIRWQDAAIPRVGQSRSDIEIWIGLAHAMARHDKKLGQRWADAFPTAWADYKNLWAEFVRLTPGVGGMTRERMMQRQEPLRWPCPDPKHPGVSTLYMDHPTWTQAAEALGHKGKRFPTPSGKVELWTLAMDKKLAVAGHAALPVFYTHPETTGGLPTLRMTSDYVKNPLNPHALTPRVELDVMVKRPDGFPLVGMIGRPSVVHFAGMTQWTWTGKLLNGVRHIQLHPKVAAQAGLRDGDEMIVESPRGAVRGTARLWSDMREDTLFLGNTFGPAQAAGDEQGLLRYEAANHLLDDHHYDNLSGQQAFKCFACRVKKA